MIECDWGCGSEAKYYFKTTKKWCCSNNVSKCKKVTQIIREKAKKRIRTPEHSKKIGISGRGKHREHMLGNKNPMKRLDCREKARLRMLNGLSKYINTIPRDPEKMKKFKISQKNWMIKNGNRLRKLIKNPSKQEVMLREMVQELYLNCEFQYSILNYEVDVAIPEYKIVIEYDGYYHFDTEEHKQYHKLRQEKIEKEGWKFLRYTMFDRFPDKEQLQNDIERILK